MVNFSGTNVFVGSSNIGAFSGTEIFNGTKTGSTFSGFASFNGTAASGNFAGSGLFAGNVNGNTVSGSGSFSLGGSIAFDGNNVFSAVVTGTGAISGSSHFVSTPGHIVGDTTFTGDGEVV